MPDKEEDFDEYEKDFISDDENSERVDQNLSQNNEEGNNENLNNNVDDSDNLNNDMQSDGSSVPDKLNKSEDYQKADNAKEAYRRKLNNENYYNEKKNQLNQKKEELENDKKNNNIKRDSAQGRLNDLKSRRANNKGSVSNKEIRDAKKENKEAQKQEQNLKNQESKLKNEEKQINKDSKKAKDFAIRHPIEASKMKAQQTIKKFVIKKIVPFILPFVLGVILIFFVIELILGPIMEAFGYLDEKITKVADFSEKVTNFYNGFGFQDTKEAFYDEINKLSERYGESLDVPLLLSTVFYTEGMGYDTNFGEMENDSAIDESLSGSNSGIWAAIKQYLREKFDEANETVDDNGLAYSVGKIYRIRKLARNQFYTNVFGVPERKGPEKKVSLSQFLDMYATNISNDIKDMFSDILSLAISSIAMPFNEALADLLDSKYKGEYFENLKLITADFASTVAMLINDVFFGLSDITDVSVEYGQKTCVTDENGNQNCDFNLVSIYITYRDFAFDEGNYNKYLKNYYIESMPEFKNLLPSTGEAREIKKEQIINDIYDNKKLFEDIFLQYVDTDSEAYTNSCVGAIDNNLVSSLSKPIDVQEGFNVNFDVNSAFGIKDGKVHKGIDLNETSTGSVEGNNVYSIADGSVSEVNLCENSTDNSCSEGAYIMINHSIVLNEKNKYEFTSVYRHLNPSSIKLSKNSNVTKGQTIGTIGGSNSGYNESYLHFEFVNGNYTQDNAIDPSNLFIPCNTSANLVGNTNEEKIWNYLLSKGYTKIAAAGIMGNWQQESGFLPNNVQNGMGYSDEDYTNGVNSGTINRDSFGNDKRGYGIAQWTYYTRKLGLYDYKNEKKVGIDDLGMQLEYYGIEATTTLFDIVNNATSPECAADKFHDIYEGSADATTRTRQKNAKDIYDRYVNGAVTNSYSYCP